MRPPADNLFDGIANFAALRAAARRAALGKRKKPGCAAFLAGLETEILRLEYELRSGTYRPGPYRAFEVNETVRRIVSAAPFRDRVVHHALCAAVQPIIDRGFIHHSYANREGRGTHKAVHHYECLRDRYAYVLRCDIWRYFPAIDHAILKQDIRRRIGCARTLDLIDRIIDNSNPQEPVELHFPGDDLLSPLLRQRGLPIGNLTSQLFANLYLDRLDHYITEVLRAPYLRYVDDFALFSDSHDQLADWQQRIARHLEHRRLRLHPRKTRIDSTQEPAPFLGYVLLQSGRRRLPEANVSRFRGRLRSMRDRYRHGTIDRAAVEARVGAWLAHAAHANTRHLRRAIFPHGWFACPHGQPGPGNAESLTGRMLVPRAARRLLEQQPEEPSRGQPQQERTRKPEQQYRVAGSPYALAPEPPLPR